MLSKLYAKWMYAWETALTPRDPNRIVRPLEWGFDWLQDFSPLAAASHAPAADDYDRMIAVNRDIVARADEFFGCQTTTALPPATTPAPPSSSPPPSAPNPARRMPKSSARPRPANSKKPSSSASPHPSAPATSKT